MAEKSGRPLAKLLGQGGRTVVSESPSVVLAFGWAHRGRPDLAKKFVDTAAMVGAWAIKLSVRHAPSYFASSRLSQWVYGKDGRMSFEACCGAHELSVEALTSVRSHATGRLLFALAVHDETSLDQALSVSPDLISIEAAAACNRILLRKVAETTVPVIVEVNWLGLEEQKKLDRLFSPERLILGWRDSPHAAFFQDRLENLFALHALVSRAAPVAFVGSVARQSSLILAMGFGASVLEVNLDTSQLAETEQEEQAPFASEVSALLSEIRRFSDMGHAPSVVSSSPEVMDIEDKTRLSVVAARDIPKGTRLTEELLAVKAPYGGMSPGLVPQIIGKRALYDIPKDTPVTLGLIEL